ncbi:hypothetical protein H1R20_g9819, partial [Candolleomyces eurysporus]
MDSPMDGNVGHSSESDGSLTPTSTSFASAVTSPGISPPAQDGQFIFTPFPVPVPQPALGNESQQVFQATDPSQIPDHRDERLALLNRYIDTAVGMRLAQNLDLPGAQFEPAEFTVPSLQRYHATVQNLPPADDYDMSEAPPSDSSVANATPRPSVVGLPLDLGYQRHNHEQQTNAHNLNDPGIPSAAGAGGPPANQVPNAMSQDPPPNGGPSPTPSMVHFFRDGVAMIREQIDRLSSQIPNEQIAGNVVNDISSIRRDLTELAAGLAETHRLIQQDHVRQGQGGQVPPDRPRQTPLLQNAVPVPRSAERNALARAVRRFFAAILSPVAPTPEQIRAWVPENGPACTIANFQPDFNSSYNVPWNRSVKAVFTQAFLASDLPEAEGADPNRVAAAFIARFRSLCRMQKLHRNRATRELELQRNRRRERKKWLYYRRVSAAQGCPETERFVGILRCYGIDGMSTDESDHGHNGTGYPQYRVKHIRWRHPAATQCFRVLDALHRNRRFRPLRRMGPGALAHQRLSSNTVSSRPPVPKLSAGLYNPDWLRSLPQWSLADLSPVHGGDSVDFSHHPSVVDFVQLIDLNVINVSSQRLLLFFFFFFLLTLVYIVAHFNLSIRPPVHRLVPSNFLLSLVPISEIDCGNVRLSFKFPSERVPNRVEKYHQPLLLCDMSSHEVLGARLAAAKETKAKKSIILTSDPPAQQRNLISDLCSNN